MNATGQQGNDRNKRHGTVALTLVGLVAAMVGLSFAAVPLYRMFCQTYGGIPQRAAAASETVLDRNIEVRFDASVDHSLPWSFTPVEPKIDIKIGETTLVFFKAANNAKVPVKGTAVFNVVPEQAARYVKKIECFCFKEQRLAAGQSVEMPVTFFVDPKIVDDEETKNISEITLSYTFFRTDAGGGAGS